MHYGESRGYGNNPRDVTNGQSAAKRHEANYDNYGGTDISKTGELRLSLHTSLSD